MMMTMEYKQFKTENQNIKQTNIAKNRLNVIIALGHHQTWIIIKQTNIGQLK